MLQNSEIYIFFNFLCKWKCKRKIQFLMFDSESNKIYKKIAMEYIWKLTFIVLFKMSYFLKKMKADENPNYSLILNI